MRAWGINANDQVGNYLNVDSADELARLMPTHAWQQPSAGPGSTGEQIYSSARIALLPPPTRAPKPAAHPTGAGATTC